MNSQLGGIPQPQVSQGSGGDALWPVASRTVDPGPIPAQDVQHLARQSLRDPAATRACADTWVQQGWTLEEVYLQGITGAAQCLGQWWLSDEIAFTDVTIASSRLHRLLYECSPAFLVDALPPRDATVLLIAEPGSQHTMGMFMLSEFFRRAGWRTLLEQPLSWVDKMRPVTRNWLDVVAISVGSDRQLDALRVWIHELRALSPNPNIRVIAGGPMAQWIPDQLLAMGVDWVGGDAHATVYRASQDLISTKVK